MEQKQVRADVTTLGTALVEDYMHNRSRTHGVSSNIYGPPTTSYLASKSSEPTFWIVLPWKTMQYIRFRYIYVL